LVAIAVAAATGWSLLKLPKHPAWFAGGFAFVMLVFFSLSKQAFVNYYFLVIGSLLLAALMAEGNSA
jgi:4-amino-4-deoxy-L-arabinose transferase-like glycosyltransferase